MDAMEHKHAQQETGQTAQQHLITATQIAMAHQTPAKNRPAFLATAQQDKHKIAQQQMDAMEHKHAQQETGQAAQQYLTTATQTMME